MARARTTLSAAVAITDTSILVASATSMAAGRVIWIEQEQMVVASNYVTGTTIPVYRGVNSVGSTHPSSAVVEHGLPSDFSSLAPPIYSTQEFQTLYGRQNVIANSGATVTLTETQSGSTCLFDRAAGIVFTLPVPLQGLYFDFHVRTSVTSNAHKVITDAAASLLIGSLINIDTDTSNAVAAWTADGSTIRSISMNGTTSGGLIGTWFRFTCVATTLWMVTGIDQGSGTVITPFATS